MGELFDRFVRQKTSQTTPSSSGDVFRKFVSVPTPTPTPTPISTRPEPIKRITEAAKPLIAPVKSIFSYVSNLVTNKLNQVTPGGIQAGIERVKQAPLTEYFPLTSKTTVGQATRRYITDTVKSAVSTIKGVGKLTTPYLVYRQTIDKPVTPKEFLTDFLDSGLYALNTAWRVRPIAPAFGSVANTVKQLRRLAQGKVTWDDVAKAPMEGINDQPGFGEVFTDNVKVARALDVAFLGTMIIRPAFKRGPRGEPSFVENRINKLNLRAEEINQVSKTLGIKPTAFLEEVERAFKNAMKKLPDTFTSNPSADNMALRKELTNAYNTLKKAGVIEKQYALAYEFLTKRFGGEIPKPVRIAKPKQLEAEAGKIVEQPPEIALAQEARKYKGVEIPVRRYEYGSDRFPRGGQDVFEPKGKFYAYHPDKSIVPDLPRGAKEVNLSDIKFENPLVVSWENWKENVSKMFGGKKGLSLSKEIAKTHDGIITIENGKPFEIVSLTDFYNQAVKGVKPEVKPVKPTMEETRKYAIKAHGELSFNTWDTRKEAEKALAYRKSIGDTGVIVEISAKPEVKPIPKELEPLAQEARKYKTAEEFVKAKSNLFHITESKNVSSILRHGFRGDLSDETKHYKGFTFFTETKENAKVFGTMLSIKNPEIVGATLKGKILDINVTDVDYKAMLKAQKKLGINSNAINAKLFKQIMKQKGYSAIRFIDIVANRMGRKKSYPVILAIDDQILTKSQLTDFYNQAVKGVKPEVEPEKKLIKKQVVEKMAAIPAEVLPVGIGRKKKSRLFERVKETLGAEYDSTNVTYNELSLEKQADSVANLIKTEPEKAARIARGLEPVPQGMTQNAVSVGLASLSETQGDMQRAASLWTSTSLRSTRLGQEIVSLRGDMTTNTPLNAVRRVINYRVDQLANKYKHILKTLDLPADATPSQIADKVITKEAKKVKQYLTEQQKRIQAAQDIIKSLIC